jgi:hypothetical protein
MLTPDEIAIRIERLTHEELMRLDRQLGSGPRCPCPRCRLVWMVGLNKFLRQVEASRN